MIRRLAILLGVTAGCLSAESMVCPSGGVCPPDNACLVDRGREICVPVSCGNGALEPGEDCDDGNSTSGDGCQSTCRLPITPSPRWGAAMAYDVLRERLVVFGGMGTEALDDTWEWDGTDWSERIPTSISTPQRRWGAAVAYDDYRGRVVLHGGFDETGQPLGDVWEWDGSGWTLNIPTSGSPRPRAGASMAFDRVRRVAVMFGGRIGNDWSDETWEWNGASWTQHIATVTPGARDHAAMAFDETRGEVVLVGGLNDASTWLWNGTRWTTIAGVDSPSLFRGSEMAYDRTSGRPLLFGGYAGIEPLAHGGTWELTATEWNQRVPPGRPPPRDAFGMAYVDSIAAVVVFGGNRPGSTSDRYADLWWWDGIEWREW